MSWGIQAIGQSGKVASKVREDIKRTTCVEPEEAIKNAIGEAIAKACEDMGGAVKVSAGGSMSSYNGLRAHSLNVTVEPLYGFVE